MATHALRGRPSGNAHRQSGNLMTVRLVSGNSECSQTQPPECSIRWKAFQGLTSEGWERSQRRAAERVIRRRRP